jgi:GNAT superfamily N-acetyltransferase
VGNLLLVADTGRVNDEWKLPDGYVVRAAVVQDVEAIGRLYFEATEARVGSQAEAVADIQRGFDGAYGDYWCEASLVVVRGTEPVACLLTVRRAPWAGTPDCPWINELFTAKSHRRRGLARALLATCMRVVAEAGHGQLALRVNEDNAPARALYGQLGFVPYER